jgi:hypothetical protein
MLLLKLDRPKKEPRAVHASQGFYRLLPQLVGSFDPGGGVGGWGAARIGLLDQR